MIIKDKILLKEFISPSIEPTIDKGQIYNDIIEELQYMCAEEGVYFNTQDIVLNLVQYSLYIPSNKLEFNWKSIIKTFPNNFGKLQFIETYSPSIEDIEIINNENPKRIIKHIDNALFYFKSAFYGCYDVYYEIDMEKRISKND